jgi:hypothetical protein
MIQQINLSRLYDTQTTAVSVDPIVEIGYAGTVSKLAFDNYFSMHVVNL